jgi:hypothetical protein
MRTYLVYDARAWGWGNPNIGVLDFDTDAALVLSSADTLAEAKGDVRGRFPEGLIFSYKSENGRLIDERFEWASCMEDSEGCISG